MAASFHIDAGGGLIDTTNISCRLSCDPMVSCYIIRQLKAGWFLVINTYAISYSEKACLGKTAPACE